MTCFVRMRILMASLSAYNHVCVILYHLTILIAGLFSLFSTHLKLINYPASNGCYTFSLKNHSALFSIATKVKGWLNMWLTSKMSIHLSANVKPMSCTSQCWEVGQIHTAAGSCWAHYFRFGSVYNQIRNASRPCGW